jgi:26S proteasome regulatory subunit N3
MVSSGSGSAKKTKNEEQSEDVEMKAVDGEASTSSTPVVVDVDVLTIEELKDQARQIEKSVSSKESRFVLRVLRSLATTRKKLNAKVMRKIINGFYTHSVNQKESLLVFIDEPMETDAGGQQSKPKATKSALLPLLPELDIYFHLLVLLYLIDLERHENVSTGGNCL